MWFFKYDFGHRFFFDGLVIIVALRILSYLFKPKSVQVIKSMRKIIIVIVFLFICLMLLCNKNNEEPLKLEATQITLYTPVVDELFYESAKHTFSFKRTYRPNEEGEFSVASKCDMPTQGCKTEIAFSFKAPEEAGMYWVEGVDESQESYKFPISVLELGARKACLLVSSFTQQAYNDSGGLSFYSGPYLKPITVSLNRPLMMPDFIAHGYVYPTVKFLDDLNVGYHIFDDLYLHQNKIDLNNSCKYLILSGHSEYWTKNMFDQITDYVDSGNDVANFSSNYSYWLTTLSEDGTKISVDKTKENRKFNRLDTKYPYIKKMLGIYYIGYPVTRFAKTDSEYKDKYPVLSTIEGLDYQSIRSMQLENLGHPIFKCIDSKNKVIADLPLQIEVDGELLQKYKKGNSQPKIVKKSTEVEGALLSAWAVYGKDLRHIVVGKDFITPSGGRVISLGSIGWLHTALYDETTYNITMNVLAEFEGKKRECNTL